MMSATGSISIESKGLYVGFGLITALSIVFGLFLENYFFFLASPILLILYLSLTDFTKVFCLLLISLPFSTEVLLPGGFGTDLPSEPFIVGCLIIGIIYFISKKSAFDASVLLHPLLLLVFLHYFWMWVSAGFAENTFVSVKYVLSKTWYIVTFLLLAPTIINRPDRFKLFFWCLFIPLLLVSLKTFFHHLLFYNLSFEEVNPPMYPFFRNHVNYSVMLTAFYPFLFMGLSWYKKKGPARFLIRFSIVFFLIAIYFSYTRACYLALFATIVVYYIIRYRLMKWVLGVLIVGAGYFTYQLVEDNHYLEYAPEYTKTIYHDEFADHIAATFKGQDVSSMERVYRWVAASFMATDRWVTGWGPGNFYPYYQKYTVSEFQTYTSGNEEMSTVHNYFLLMFTEQGIPGLIIFCVLTVAIFLYGEKTIRQFHDSEGRIIAISVVLSLTTLYVNLLLNDLIETDKAGSFYFMGIGFLALLDRFSTKRGFLNVS